MLTIKLGSFTEDVYATMCGQIKEGYRIAGVENEFAQGKDCDRWLAQAYAAKERLCLKMYEYGAKFGLRE